MTESVINLEYLTSISDQDREFEAELLTVFLEDSQIHLQAARDAFNLRDWNMISMEAHHLKGSSGNVGAELIQTLASTLETLAKTEDGVAIPGLLVEITDLLEQVKQFFNDRYNPAG